MIVVSPYSQHVGVVHTYDDHVSFDKFVEANWRLGPISRRNRDNLPDPVASRRDLRAAQCPGHRRPDGHVPLRRWAWSRC